MNELEKIFNDAFEHIVMIEGGYTDDPNDSGGKTRYGVTEAVARANGYTGAMSELPLEVARAIYKRQYWDLVRGDDIAVLSTSVARELFDTAINMGVNVAGKFLQRALNALNRGAVDYQDVDVDGVIGPMTVHCLQKFLLRRLEHGEAVILRALNSLQLARYIEIAEARPKDEAYVYGWILQRVKL